MRRSPFAIDAGKGKTVLSWALDAEPGTVLQAQRTARSPVVSGPLALMPDAHVGSGTTIGSVIPTEAAIIPAAVGVDLGCFVGETKIPLLDGSQRTLRSMAESNQTFWVYSIDQSSIQVAPGRAIALRTRRSAELVRVVVSGGDEIVCTPDHEFMLRDGNYRPASSLKFNDSLMPLYRQWQARDGYESANNGKGTTRQTHRRVYEHLHGPVVKGKVVHHTNGNHFDNRPENLELLDVTAHSAHHRRVGHRFDNDDPEFQARRLEGIRQSAATPERQARMAAVGRHNIVTYMTDRPDHFAASVEGNGARGATYLREFNTTPRDCDQCDHTAKNPAALRWHKERVHQTNHKVVSVTPLDEKADVYCLQVEEHHNFALAAGVFVRNCGMTAVRTAHTAAQLPDGLPKALDAIAAAVPAGFRGHSEATPGARRWLARNPLPDAKAAPDKAKAKMAAQLGTLGGGNHFIEMSLDEDDAVWVVLHSGSRGVGNMLATTHIKAAKRTCAEAGRGLEDKNLAYFMEGDAGFAPYVADMLWAQDYALSNRRLMTAAVLAAFRSATGLLFDPVETIDCHHNYAQRETHSGRVLWVTRKGAIRARPGDRGVVPGSMGDDTYIVTGKGCAESYHSSAHGAGRVMSRSQAKRELTADELVDGMSGRVWQADMVDRLVDEAPGAYRDIAAVMAAQEDLVTVDHKLTAILNYKGC